MLINVSRGGLIDTEALINALHNGKLRGAGLDVYEHEHELFFEDRSQYSYKEIGKHWDNKFAILRSYPNVIVTPHSAFLTDEALANIAKTTIENV